MLIGLILALLIQSPRMGGRSSATSVTANSDLPMCDTMAKGAKEHFAAGITVIGKLIWPSDMVPRILEIELEDDAGIVVDETKSEPNNQFRFNRVQVVNPVSCSFKTYYVTINADGLNIVRQPLVLTTNNFAGAEIKVQLKHVPGFVARSSEAVVSVNSLKQETPKAALAAFDKAMDEARKGEVKKSSAELEKAVRLHPDFYEANLELGIQYAHSARYDEAERLLTHALEINPASMRARAELGKHAFEQSNFEKAAELLGQAVQLGNTSAEVYFMLGESSFQLDKLDVAEASLLRALAISPNTGQANLALHNLYLKRRQLDKALNQLETYMQKHPDAENLERARMLADRLRKAIPQ